MLLVIWSGIWAILLLLTTSYLICLNHLAVAHSLPHLFNYYMLPDFVVYNMFTLWNSAHNTFLIHWAATNIPFCLTVWFCLSSVWNDSTELFIWGAKFQYLFTVNNKYVFFLNYSIFSSSCSEIWISYDSSYIIYFY